jgi:chromosome segregation ATPase
MVEEKRKAKEKQKKYIRYAFAIAGLIFAVFFILSLIAHNKRLEEERLRGIAYSQRDSVTKEISKLKTFLNALKADSARLSQTGKLKIIYRDTSNSSSIIPDTNAYKLRIDLLLKDSIYFAGRISFLESVIVILRDSVRDNTTELTRLKTEIIVLKDTIDRLRTLILEKDRNSKDLNDRYFDLKSKYESVLVELKEVRKQLADCIRNCTFPPNPINQASDTSKCLKIELNYSNATDYYPSLLPDKLNIYLIPYTQKNISLIKEASNYYQVDESRLAQAEGRIKGQYNGSYFIFPNLKSGQKYFLKVSTLYGNYLIYNRTTDNCETEQAQVNTDLEIIKMLMLDNR